MCSIEHEAGCVQKTPSLKQYEIWFLGGEHQRPKHGMLRTNVLHPVGFVTHHRGSTLPWRRPPYAHIVHAVSLQVERCCGDKIPKPLNPSTAPASSCNLRYGHLYRQDLQLRLYARGDALGNIKASYQCRSCKRHVSGRLRNSLPASTPV
jgi:hypothetical protein